MSLQVTSLDVAFHSFFNIFLQIDGNYVGIPPPLEVTICNLNDNIDKAFLSDMVRI